MLPVFGPLGVVLVLGALRLLGRRDPGGVRAWRAAVNSALSAAAYAAGVWTLFSPRGVLLVALVYAVVEVISAFSAARGEEKRWPGVLPFLR